ncbi:MAG TPA: cell division protein ZapA [Candidatus Acidoferrales bacterium]|nr:cell division protein ZapA [Candidatus Acidoferrales bacterium]
MADNNVRVEIYDQSYNLRGSDEEHIRKLSDYVDRKMRSVAEHTSTVDSLRVAVLAALNIADELMIIKSKYENVASEYTNRASSLRNALDSALEEALLESRRAG